MKRLTLTTLLILAATGGMASAQYSPYGYQGPATPAYRPPAATVYTGNGNTTFGSDGSWAQRTSPTQTFIYTPHGSTLCTSTGNATLC